MKYPYNYDYIWDFEKLPKKINPCPIHEALFSLKYSTNKKPLEIFGIYFEKNKKTKLYENYEEVTIPKELREKDPNLAKKPYYIFKSDQIVLQIGLDFLTINNINGYLGWSEFNKKISDAIETLYKESIIEKIDTVYLRYIDIFDFNIFDKLNLELNITAHNKKETFITDNTRIETIVQGKEATNKLVILNSANFGGMGTKSVIDIETFHGAIHDAKRNKSNEKDYLFKKLEKMHRESKQIFFSLIDLEKISNEKKIEIQY